MNRIKEVREIHGLTQKQLAEEVGVTRATIANWEINFNPNVQMVKKLSEVLPVSPLYLMGLSDSMYDNFELLKHLLTKESTMITSDEDSMIQIKRILNEK
ncbi:helix-turn-helix transcriptional regulator [Ligilactobacillus agilis]|uniref:helix-turn-helix transcriptional regulator n=1 Tax=Ligilactobacillus agilis TaxID=1601 RepID=UPI0022DF0922|nr:helix-turn-helix transcriptional regulator [Ligilactobacillus agilis]